MISRNLYMIFGLLFITIINSCNQDNLEPIENDNIAPGPISNAQVKNLPGAVQFTYSLPTDPDLLYVEAKYVNKNGTVMMFKSSYYTNILTAEGFGDTTEYNVELYAVDRSENKSAPVTLRIKPLEPPFLTALSSINVKADFGGITVSYKNPVKAQLAIGVITTDSIGDYVTADMHYTSRDSASFSVRGYASVPRIFGVFTRDKWGNYSDTIFNEYVPIYEMMLDKSKFSQYNIMNLDAPTSTWGGNIIYIWDGRVSGDADGSWGAHSGNIATGVPMFWTIDLGVTARLTRFTLQTVSDDKHWFNDVSPRKYEIWGSTSPASDGSFTGWTKLATVENLKPSGLPVGQLSEDDRTAGRIGDEANFSLDLQPVRYIRVRCLLNWGGNTNMVFSEITFWGAEANSQ